MSNYDKVRKVNIGCGTNKIEGHLNIDADPNVKPDLVTDIRFCRLPFEDGQIDEIFMSHTIEHVQKRFWPTIFMEFNRILRMGGTLVLTYPEFSVCADFWKSNRLGKRDYWEACIYGRQDNLLDTHVSLCDSTEMIRILKDYGFREILAMKEFEPQYSILSAIKFAPIRTKEDELDKVVFGNDKAGEKR